VRCICDWSGSAHRAELENRPLSQFVAVVVPKLMVVE